MTPAAAEKAAAAALQRHEEALNALVKLTQKLTDAQLKAINRRFLERRLLPPTRYAFLDQIYDGNDAAKAVAAELIRAPKETP